MPSLPMEQDKQNGMPSNKDVVQELQEILRNWEDDQVVPTNNPTIHLKKLCDLFERETVNFLKQDPDPFDDRHPVTSKPECALGQILRALFKKDTFVTKLVNHYLKDNYFINLSVHHDITELNTTGCRLLLDLLHGLDIPQVFRDSDSTVVRLYSWAEKANEPLRTYATGLLAAAMDIPELATSFREQNAHLVPIILKRLWEIKDEDDCKQESSNEISDRPFAHLNSVKESDCVAPHKEVSHEKLCSEEKPVKNTSTFQFNCSPRNPLYEPIDTSPKNGEHVHCENSIINSDCSNSSWVEMSSFLLGLYKMHPIEKATKELFMLKYLRPVGEYQESLGHVYEHHALELVFHYINLRHTNHARLSFEALRFLGSLLFHKKFCIEFVNMGGIQKLLQVPRPSLPSDGVALCLWYLAYCEEAIERTCLLPDNILTELIRYALWLLECSHQSSRMHAVMFFGMVFKFRAILEKFDEQDGLRKILNILSTLSIFQDNSDDDSNELMMWQTIKQVCLTIKNYFESHLAIRIHQLQRISSASSSSSSCSSLSSFQHATPAYKALNVTQDSVDRNIEYLLEHLPYRSRWKAVENFLALNGLQILLRLVATMMHNDSLTMNKNETAVSALDIIHICSVMPSVQLALSDKVMIPVSDDISEELHPQHNEVSGYEILVSSIPETNQSISSSPEVQKAALCVLVNALCAPLHGINSSVGTFISKSFSSSSTPASGSSSKKLKTSSSEDIIRKSWDCVRNSNGIMNLLSLLHKKVPITDADCIRGLACRALVGLSRSETGQQIMSKLPIFSSGQLQLLMKEPILQDKRIEHIKFQQHCLELFKAVSGRSKSQENSSSVDVSIQSIHKANVVAQTPIIYNKTQLLQMINEYLRNEGYDESASTLRKEASLPQIPISMGPPIKSIINTPRTSQNLRNRLFSNSSLRSSRCSPSLSVSPRGSPVMDQSSIGSSNTGTTGCTTPIQIKIGSRTIRKCPAPSTAAGTPETSSGNFSKIEKGLLTPQPYTHQNDRPVTLDRIVIEYLTNQHALCENPVVTCPTFDLLQPHRCPAQKSMRASVSSSLMTRLSKQAYDASMSGTKVRAANRKFIYSRYRPSHVFKPIDDEVFLTCEFTLDDQNLLVGSTRGEVRIFNKYNDNVIAQETVHQGFVTSLVPHIGGELLLTSSSSSHESALWNIKDFFENKFTLNDCQHAEFTNAYDKILGTLDETAKLYDINTGVIIHEFKPKLSNLYKVNKAALDPSDELLLTDGVLFDIRSGKKVHKFDKINPILNGIFHKNGLEIISSSEIWDLRTFHLLRTVPSLSLCDVSFNHYGDVIFGLTVGDDESEENAYETSFKTVDATDYSSIATVDVRRIVSSLAINPTDTAIAVVEADGTAEDMGMESAVVRLYDIGMIRQEEDDDLDDDDEDDMGTDEEDSDDSDPNDGFIVEDHNSSNSGDESDESIGSGSSYNPSFLALAEEFFDMSDSNEDNSIVVTEDEDNG